MKKIKSRFSYFFFIVVWTFFCFALFEGVARFWIHKYGDPLDRAKVLLRADGKLGWRQKENFKGSFLNIPVRTNELGLRNQSLEKVKKADKRILVLGPSSTFGWGVHENETYASRLKGLLSVQLPKATIDVVNAGQIGFSSWQGLQFYRQSELQAIHANVVIFAYGINDLDRFRFFQNNLNPDHIALAEGKSPLLIAIQNQIDRLLFPQLFLRKILTLLSNYSSFFKAPLAETLTPIPSLRVPLENFEKNVRSFIKIAKKNQSKVILLTSAYYVPEPYKEKSLEKEKAGVLFKKGVRAFQQNKALEAAAFFEQSIKKNPNQNEAYYYLYSCYSALGEASLAKKFFQKARLSESNRIKKDVQKLNRLIKQLAKEKNVYYYDITSLLKLTQSGKMFVDLVHPSPLGHSQIADELYQIIQDNRLLR